MTKEMDALYSNGTWEFVALPPGKPPVSYRWVYIVNVGPEGQVDRLKARLVAKGYTQLSVRYVLPYISSQKLVHDSCILAMYIL